MLSFSGYHIPPHRVGGLENTKNPAIAAAKPPHRVGGLESY